MNEIIQTEELTQDIKEDFVYSMDRIYKYFYPPRSGKRLKAGLNLKSIYFDDKSLIEAFKVYIKWINELKSWGTKEEATYDGLDKELIPQHLKLYGSNNPPKSGAILDARDSLLKTLSNSDDICLIILLELQAYINSMTYFQNTKANKKSILKVYNKHSEHVNYFQEIGLNKSIINRLNYSFVNKYPEYKHLIDKNFFLFYFNKEINYVVQGLSVSNTSPNTIESQRDWFHLCMYKTLENTTSSTSGPRAIIIALLSKLVGDHFSGDIIRKVKGNSTLTGVVNLHFNNFYYNFITEEKMRNRFTSDKLPNNEIDLILFPFDLTPKRTYKRNDTSFKISKLKDLPSLDFF